MDALKVYVTVSCTVVDESESHPTNAREALNIKDNSVVFNPLAGDFIINVPHEYYHTINKSDNFNSEYVSIPKKEYLALLECQKWQTAMESAGINNWKGYSEGISILEKMKDE